MRKIAVIDDDQDILDLVCFNLKKAGFRCLAHKSGDRALELICKEKPDLIVLDIMLPGPSGTEILKRLQSDTDLRHIPVVLLTAKGEELDRVLGFELGAEDYVSKPFSVRELILRIERILHRLDEPDEPQRLLCCNDIVLDNSRYEVFVGKESVRLTTTEFNLLAFFLRNQGRVLSRERLLERVWGFEYEGTTRTIDTHIQRLRDKLGQKGKLIETVRGVGYKLEAETVQ